MRIPIGRFTSKVYRLLEEEDLSNTWNESSSVSYAAIKGAVYWALDNELVSFSDLKKAVNRSIEMWKKEHNYRE